MFGCCATEKEEQYWEQILNPKQSNQTAPRNCLKISAVEDLQVTTEVRENLLTVISDILTSDSYYWCCLRYCERNITLLSSEKCIGNAYFFGKMFFQWRRWESLKGIQTAGERELPFCQWWLHDVLFLFHLTFPCFYTLWGKIYICIFSYKITGF